MDHAVMASMKNAQFLHIHPPPSLTPCPLLFCLSKWVRIGQDLPTPGHQNLGYQPPTPSPTPIHFGILKAYI